jgi:hypothetical protein
MTFPDFQAYCEARDVIISHPYDLLRPWQAAIVLGKGERTIYRMISQGLLQGKSRPWGVYAWSLQAYLETPDPPKERHAAEPRAKARPAKPGFQFLHYPS